MHGKWKINIVWLLFVLRLRGNNYIFIAEWKVLKQIVFLVARQMAGGCTAILLTEMNRNWIGTLYKRHTQLESELRQRGHQPNIWQTTSNFLQLFPTCKWVAVQEVSPMSMAVICHAYSELGFYFIRQVCSANVEMFCTNHTQALDTNVKRILIKVKLNSSNALMKL